MKDLEELCRDAVTQRGIGRKTCYFAWAAGGDMAIHRIQEITVYPPRVSKSSCATFSTIERSFTDRRKHGLEADVEAMPFWLSQGYKRGLRWQDIPLGKSCYDVCIYQQMLQELRPRTIIEFGTAFGGSALFFADHARMFGLDAKIITLDVNADDIEDLPLWPDGSLALDRALRGVAAGSLVVDTFYSDMFGRNATCSPDAIFRKVR